MRMGQKVDGNGKEKKQKDTKGREWAISEKEW